MENRLLIIGVMLLALLGGVGLHLGLKQGGLSKTVSHQVVPDFQLPDVNGRLQSIKQWQGNKLLIINFWATWCPACLEELPLFADLQLRFQSAGVQFIGISLDTVTDVSAYLAQHPLAYPQLIAGDSGMSLAQSLGNQAMVVPFTILVSSQGEVIGHRAGAWSGAELEAFIGSYL